MGPQDVRDPGYCRGRKTDNDGSCPDQLGDSYYENWEGKEIFVRNDPLGNPVDERHPWNQHTIPKPQKRNFDDKYSWVMSPRWYDGKDHLALDTGGGPIARLWVTALAGLVDIGYVKATGKSVVIN